MAADEETARACQCARRRASEWREWCQCGTMVVVVVFSALVFFVYMTTELSESRRRGLYQDCLEYARTRPWPDEWDREAQVCWDARRVS